MKKKLFLPAILVFLLSIRLSAQMPGPKYEKVFETSDETISVDTSSIKQFENQISVLVLTVYKTLQKISSINKEAASVKSQLLFNAISKKYSLIGTLYYDKNLKILGETSLPGFSSGGETFSLLIEGNKAMTEVFNFCVNYLNSGLSVIEEKSSPTIIEGNNPPASAQSNREPVPEKPAMSEKDSLQAIERVQTYLNKKDSVEKTSLEPPQVNEKTQAPVQEKTTPVVENKPVINNSSAESEKETNPKSTIFKLGDKYSFQVSSWRNKSKADMEVARLKKNGHNAFITEGRVRGATWYRVRIGYFNSIEETESYMKKLK